MRSTEENTKIDQLARALLKRRGIAEQSMTFEQYADAAEIAAEAVARGKETVPEMLAVGAIGSDTPDEQTTRVLSKFATDGKFVRDLSLDEQELLDAAIAAEEQKEKAVLASAREEAAAIIAASAEDPYCPTCGYHLIDYGCQCRKP